MTQKLTEQADFWRSEFGEGYIERNAPDANNLRDATIFWSKITNILRETGSVPSSIFEVGPNIGINLRCLKELTGAEVGGIEPNPKAIAVMEQDGVIAPGDVLEGVGHDIARPDNSCDMAFTNGVMIHIHPDDLDATCHEMYRISRRYILCSEYFSVSPQAIEYRGHSNKLFKRDFGSHWLSLYPDMKLIRYGFEWKPITGLDNMTWWLFEK